MFSASKIKGSISQRSLALHHVTPEHLSYWCLKWQYDGENTKMIELPSVLPWGVPLVYVWKHSNCLLRIPRCNVCFLDSFLFSLLQSFLNFAVRFKNIKPLIRCGLSLNDLSGYRVFIHGKIIKRNFLIALKASPMKYVQSPIFAKLKMNICFYFVHLFEEAVQVP